MPSNVLQRAVRPKCSACDLMLPGEDVVMMHANNV